MTDNQASQQQALAFYHLALQNLARYANEPHGGGGEGPSGGIRDSTGRAQPATATSRVLVVDDERLIADSLAQILRARGHGVRVAYGGAEAISAAEQECPDIVLTDVLMPRVNGVQAAIAIRDMCPDTRIILFSGQAVTTDLLREARAAGHDFEIWGKPLHPRDLLRKLAE